MSIKVLIVDDSATMRQFLSMALSSDPEIEVVGMAENPHEARTLIKALSPDVLTLDVEMPEMNGLEFLEKIMRLRPMPVVMVSTLTHMGTEVALAALELGAVDVVGKPTSSQSLPSGFHDLITKVKAAAQAKVRKAPPAAVTPPGRLSDRLFIPNPGHIVAIGASTGGVEALLNLIPSLPKNCPPVVLTQHMPATFTPNFAARLDRASALQVMEAEDGTPLMEGHVYLAPGEHYHLEVVSSLKPRCRLVDGDLINGHKPSVDALFKSVALLNRPMTGVILTGMGRDGAEGLLAMRQAGAATIGQDEATSIVYGMPKVAHEIGAVDRQLPLSSIAQAIVSSCSAQKS
ncbi:protein-glutamate methylesterase/protein-glutamine glutaminase [Candidatus Phycosocius spiralis]|uniref:Protein-glutamate methylesterase/protein-glutamine glutaminase n=1 Tax=Candidatus Phycosocius spiralis TaxID=2815099 RepID=A0ABQ4PXJ2_9PROT|nr:chemotaxis response regulator protein-glutamate methylesterase [Candidatus Phycosocius spiralis]GIU67781.1 chemotaxis response regulator protein-glutamate methylesterase of group 1 operon [Candidatus Phycosocius spiralis]